MSDFTTIESIESGQSFEYVDMVEHMRTNYTNLTTPSYRSLPDTISPLTTPRILNSPRPLLRRTAQTAHFPCQHCQYQIDELYAEIDQILRACTGPTTNSRTDSDGVARTLERQ